MSNDPRQYGGGRSEVLTQRISDSTTLCVQYTSAGKLVERLEGRAVDPCERIQDLETPNGVENLLDHLRTHFEPTEVFRRGRIEDDFVDDFEGQPGEEIRDYDTRFIQQFVETLRGSGWTSESFD